MSTQTRIVVLGGGRVGSAIARDLAADAAHAVTVVDRDEQVLESFVSLDSVRTETADLSRPESVRERVEGSDLVIGAVPGFLGFQTLRTVIEAGRNVVDISFFEEDPFSLDELAAANGVTAVVDCGVAPGLSNLVLGRALSEFEEVESFTCLVGGLPQEPVAPWCYRAPYSPPDVIEMYTRPARLRRGGSDLTMPALTEAETLEFPGIGRLEAFNTDGLRTLLTTCPVPELAEKTLRYPGHRDQISLLASAGFFGREPREVDGTRVRPFDLTSSLLAEQWSQGEEDRDVTVMRLLVEGRSEGERYRVTYDLCDYSDRERGVSSMARTTGYPCTAVARLVARGAYRQPGISPPEFIGKSEAHYRSILSDLEARGISFQIARARLDPTTAAPRWVGAPRLAP